MRDIARFFLRYSRSTKPLNRISGFAEDTHVRQSKLKQVLFAFVLT